MRNYIVFVCKDHYNPLGIVRTLGEAGINPIAVVVKSDPRLVSKSKYVKTKHIVNTPEEGIQLILSKYAVSKKEKSFILTGDDVTVTTCDQHFDELKDYFYFYNAGEAGRIRRFMNKDNLNEVAVRNGFKIPKTWKVNPGDIPDDIKYPVMTKSINSFGSEWKSIVFICNNEKELKEAYLKIHSDQILLQQYIEKVDEYGYEGFSVNHGKDVFISMQTSQVYSIPDKYTPYWYINNVNDEILIQKAKNMIADIGLDGIWEFEFLVDKNGDMYFLEINFRITVIGWATTVAGMPSITLWCKSMEQGYISNDCKKEIPEGFTCMAECWDYDERVKSGILTHKEWMKQYKSVNAKLYKGRNDFRPFFSFMWYKLTRMKLDH